MKFTKYKCQNYLGPKNSISGQKIDPKIGLQVTAYKADAILGDIV